MAVYPVVAAAPMPWDFLDKAGRLLDAQKCLVNEPRYAYIPDHLMPAAWAGFGDWHLVKVCPNGMATEVL
jgi:hypothetical protein